jgi:hypothetical protein
LFIFTDVTNKCVGFECSTVGDASINNNAILEGPLFEALSSLDGFNSRESKMMFDKKKGGVVVNENATTSTCWERCLAKGITGTSQGARFEVIDRDIGTRAKVVDFEKTKSFCAEDMCGTACRAAMPFGFFTGGTQQLLAASEALVGGIQQSNVGLLLRGRACHVRTICAYPIVTKLCWSYPTINQENLTIHA